MDNKITVEDFLNTEVINFAVYNSIRSIANVVDGLKNAHRKVIFGIANINKFTKVSILSAQLMSETEYLHGDISGSIVSLGKGYVGSNNMPLILKDGNFGTRSENEASAARYIFAGKTKYHDKLFNKEDNNILIKQNFEGTDIEPRFFVPTLPLILINGSEGISTGFAQKILPRKLETIKEYIRAYLAQEETPELKVHYNGFNGTIKNTGNPNQIEIDGVFTRDSLTKLTITEIPIGISLNAYTKTLDDLEEAKIISSFTDLSDSKKDVFKFEVRVTSAFLKNTDDWIIQKLKLRKTVTENFTVIDENNRVITYNSPEEVINHYIKVKIQFNEKRKDYLIEKTKQDLLVLASKYLFVKNIVDGNIIVNKTKKDDIISQISTYPKIIKVNDSYSYLLNMQIYNLTLEKLDELLEQIKDKKAELTDITNKKIEDTWLEEISAI